MFVPIVNANAVYLGHNLLIIDAKGRSYEAVVVDLGKVTEPDEEEGGDITRTIMVIVESRAEGLRNWEAGKWQRRILHANDDGVLDMWEDQPVDDTDADGETMVDVRTVLAVG